MDDTGEKKLIGNEATRFRKGVSGNPRGRPKGFGTLVREKVDPNAIIDFCLEVMGDLDAKHTDRIAAARIIIEYGWGKPLANVTIDANIRTEARAGFNDIDPARLTEAQLIELDRLLVAATADGTVIDVESDDTSDRS